MTLVTEAKSTQARQEGNQQNQEVTSEWRNYSTHIQYPYAKQLLEYPSAQHSG